MRHREILTRLAPEARICREWLEQVRLTRVGVGGRVALLLTRGGEAMETAFPSQLRGLMPAVQACLESSPMKPTGLVQSDPVAWGEVRVGGEVLRIPCRHYDRPLGPVASGPSGLRSRTGRLPPSGLEGESRLVWMAWFTRSGNGFVRQAAVRELFGSPREWVVPYLMQLLGEYVIEVCSDIADCVEGTATRDADWAAAFGRFWSANPGFVALTRARAVSYWNEYYRWRLELADYPAARALRVLDRLV